MEDSTEQGSERNGIAESRAHPRVGVHSLAYIELGDGNAGIVLNISETGLAVQTVQVLSSDQFSQITFRLPKTDNLIEASGKVVWQIRAKKQAGIEFVGLPDATRAAIKNWMAEQLRPVDMAAEEAPAIPGRVGPAPQGLTDPPPELGRVAAIAQPRPEAQNAAEGMTEKAGDPGSSLSPATPSTVPPIANPLIRSALGAAASPESSADGDIRRLLLGTPGSVPLPHFGYVPPGAAVRDLKKPRPWLPFAATIGLLSAAALAALTTLVPGAITRARMAVLAHLEGQNASEQTAEQSDQTENAAQQPAASPGTASAPDAQDSLPTVLPGDTDTPSDSTNGVVPTSNQPEPIPSTPGPTTKPPYTQRSNGSRAIGTGAQPESTTAPADASTYYARNHPIASQNPTESQVGNSRGPEQPSGSSAEPNRRTGMGAPVERDQDLYARQDSARLTQQPQSFEMPNSYSSPVEPSLPLSGIPSGSVAASSQFRGVLGQNPTAGQLQIGQLVSSYSPAYPVEAAREGIEGTVKLAVIVGRDGAVRNIRVVSGPAMLTSVAAAAVRDWRYAETFLAGQPIETEQYVTIVFRLSRR